MLVRDNYSYKKYQKELAKKKKREEKQKSKLDKKNMQAKAPLPAQALGLSAVPPEPPSAADSGQDLNGDVTVE